MAKQKAIKPKRGRPPLPPADRRRQMVSVRFRDETRAHLEQLAQESGRPLSQEIEHRIEQSFERRRLMQEVLEDAFGTQLAALLVAIGEAARVARIATNLAYQAHDTGVQNDRNLRDPWVYSEVTAAIADVLHKLSPDDPPKPPPEWVEKKVSTGKMASISTMDALLNGRWPHVQWVTTVLVGLLRAKEHSNAR